LGSCYEAETDDGPTAKTTFLADGRGAFVKLELVEIYDGIYYDYDPTKYTITDEESNDDEAVKLTSADVHNESDNPDGNKGEGTARLIYDRSSCIIARFRTVKDYYGKISVGEVITIPIAISTIMYNRDESIPPTVLYSVAKDEAIKIITGWDSLFLYTLDPENRNYGPMLYTAEGEKIYNLQNNPGGIRLDSRNLFPIVDGKLDDGILEYFPENDPAKSCMDYCEYFRDGMTEGELIESIERLYREQTETGE
jgi:hypothetical protein